MGSLDNLEIFIQCQFFSWIAGLRTDGNLLDNFDEDEDDLAVDEMEDDGFSFEL